MNIWVVIYRFAWTVLVVLALAALIGFFAPKVRQYQDMKRAEERKQEEIQFEDDMLRHLKTKQERLMNDPRFAEKIAREELGLAKPGETVFKFVNDNPTNSRTAHP